MMRVFCVLTVAALGCAQTITAPFPPVPASLSVFAGEGDLTYCQAVAVKGTLPAFTLTCRKSGATYYTATVIKSSGVFSNGDITWVFNWDASNPRLVHVQASGNVRDPAVFAAWLSFGTLTGEFQIGESVHDAGGFKLGTVTHWTHSTGSMLVDGVQQPTYGAQISLGNVTAPFVVGDQIIGAASGATGTIGQVSAITSNKLKSAADVLWPAAAPGFFRRLFRK